MVWDSESLASYTPLATTHDGGRSWVFEKVAAYLSFVSCTAPETCVAIGAPVPSNGLIDSFLSSDGGTSWLMGGSLGKQNPSAVACASATRCVEVGQDVLTTVNGGKSWQQGQAPTMLGFGLSLACPTTVWCMAVGKGPEAHAYTTSNGGRDWGEVASPGPQSFGDIGCTRGGACELMGGPNH